METKTKKLTIQSVAKEMYDNMQHKKRDDGSKFCCLDGPKWQTDIIIAAHAPTNGWVNDDGYCRIYALLCTFTDADVDEDADLDAQEEVFSELVYDQEPDVYTSDLTTWLGSHAANVEYLTEALEEYGTKEGSTALAQAQGCYLREIGHALLNGIIEYIKENE